MSRNEGLRPDPDAETKIPVAPRTEREIVADVMDGSRVMEEDFPKAIADLVMSDLGIRPSKEYVTTHDVRRAAEAGARTAIRVARALVGPPDDLGELERRISSISGSEGEAHGDSS